LPEYNFHIDERQVKLWIVSYYCQTVLIKDLFSGKINLKVRNSNKTMWKIYSKQFVENPTDLKFSDHSSRKEMNLILKFRWQKPKTGISIFKMILKFWENVAFTDINVLYVTFEYFRVKIRVFGDWTFDFDYERREIILTRT